MRRAVASVALTASLLGVAAVPAAADTVPPSPAFGPHVSGMAPEHPLEHGAMFGTCVSTMAQGATCSHA